MHAKKNFTLDIAVLVVYLIVSCPALTGITVHEWLGLGVFVVVLLHCAVHLDWIVESFKSLLKKTSAARKGNLLLDILIGVVCTVVMASGVLMSGAVLPAFGWYADGYYFWNPLHAISAKVLLALVVVHMVVHVKWLINTIKNRQGDSQ